MVNTLELRGIDTYSPEIQTFVREIEQSFLQVLNNCVPANQQEKEAIQLRDMVEGIGNCIVLPVKCLNVSLVELLRKLIMLLILSWCRNPDIEAFELNYLEIQPIVVPASHVAYENIGWDEQGEVIPGISMTVVRRIPTRNLTWLKSIVENYGKEFFEKFAIFCDDWHIWDLHEDNIGFLRTPDVELPIILDWMSD